MVNRSLVIWSIIFPGLGHFAQNRYWRSTILVILSAACLDFALVTSFITGGNWQVSLAAFGLFLILWGWALSDTIKFARTQPKLEPRKLELYKKGLLAYLRNEMQKAEQFFNQILEFDASDVDAHYALGRVLMAQNKTEPAQRHMRRVLDSRDESNGKWVWEAQLLLSEEKVKDSELVLSGES